AVLLCGVLPEMDHKIHCLGCSAGLTALAGRRRSFALKVREMLTGRTRPGRSRFGLTRLAAGAVSLFVLVIGVVASSPAAAQETSLADPPTAESSPQGTDAQEGAEE